MKEMKDIVDGQLVALNDKMPFHKQYLNKSRGAFNIYTSLFIKSSKYIVDAEELSKFQEDLNRKQIDISAIINGVHKSMWVEFFDLKNEFHRMQWDIGKTVCGRKFHLVVNGFGYDCEDKSLYLCMSENNLAELRRFTIPKNNHLRLREDMNLKDFQLIYALELVDLMRHYIQPEYTSIEERKVGTGKKKLRKGKLKEEKSEYQLVRRKRKLYIVTNESEKTESEKVEWANRWEVKGHWRRVKGLGKDQWGNPNMGMTWVHEHVKGPEDKPLFKKTIVLVNH